MQQAFTAATTRWVLRNPRVIRPIGAALAISGAIGLAVTIHAYRAYPSAPEPMTLKAAVQRADAGGNTWVTVPAPTWRCDLAVRQQEYTYVPMADVPLVIANLFNGVDCRAIDRAAVVGTIRRAPARWVRRVVGETTRPVYELTTWGGPENLKWGVYLALAAILAGIILAVIGATAVRRHDARAR